MEGVRAPKDPEKKQMGFYIIHRDEQNALIEI